MARPAKYRFFRCTEDRSYIRVDRDFPKGGLKKGEVYEGELIRIYGASRVVVVGKPVIRNGEWDSHHGIDVGWGDGLFREVFKN